MLETPMNVNCDVAYWHSPIASITPIDLDENSDSL